jgi:hypothetical protein
VPKGDASIAYAKPEAVDAAIEVLDGGFLRPNVIVNVTRGNYLFFFPSLIFMDQKPY